MIYLLSIQAFSYDDTDEWIYEHSSEGILYLRCDLDMLPGQTKCTHRLPIDIPQTYSFYSGVFTTGIGDAVFWKVEIDFYWNCRRFVLR